VPQVLGRSGHSDVAVTDKVDVASFVQAWALLGLPVSSSYAAGLFNKYGQDVRGRLPVMVSSSVPHSEQMCLISLMFLRSALGTPGGLEQLVVD
jgi:hypothetical protein